VLTNAPGSDRLYVAELRGKVFSFKDRPATAAAPPDTADVVTPDPFADLAQDIKGFRRAYGLTFHPEFQKNRYCYICYVLAENLPEGTRVSRFKVTETNPPRLDVASEQVLITWRSGGHNGGCLKFGPVTSDQIRLIKKMKDDGEKIATIARATGLSRQTVYDVLAVHKSRGHSWVAIQLLANTITITH